ncbi:MULTISPECIES: hypothetical protein [Halorubrum]|uniref:Uncharacterized protein n=1 Tax=Halorubrum salinarum TaxID=2739057 RepID=A0A7D4BS53_9EURY|nr:MULTISPECIES: hypothetical protein [Halorubrum]TKX87505.1 hypothetical protein EXE43_02695 [Halorubrum sp. SS5]QKG94277.1 hypothetical protein HPS36_15415 [Halorubrum salinarum]TKX57292.1 hypothetical protein EXE44_11040 [Halorubrum sp. SS7]TKX63987.1 hypothetical protein EXE45_16735 [Halorubrum sp. SP9]TKX80338.1 hypothetical protein EXE53_11320 [Halorubrum sp. SD626R]
MSRAVSVATAFLVGVCVFAWLAGPVLEARFGAEALLAAYGAVAAGTAATTYVLVRRVDARLSGGETSGDEPTTANEVDTADNDGRNANAGEDETLIVRFDDLDDLDVEREVRQLKAERSGSGKD